MDVSIDVFSWHAGIGFGWSGWPLSRGFRFERKPGWFFAGPRGRRLYCSVYAWKPFSALR